MKPPKACAPHLATLVCAALAVLFFNQKMFGFIWSAAAAFMIGTNIYYVRAARSDMAAIAAAVEHYRTANGRLPDTLEAAGLHIADSFEVRYNYWKDLKKHSLLYRDPLLPLEYYSYDFDRRRWLHDNGEPVTD